MQVDVYTRSKTVKLELNGKIIAEQIVPEGSITATFQIEYQPGTLVAKSFDDGKQTGSSTLSTTGKPFAIRLNHSQHPNQRGSVIGREQRVWIREPIDDRGQVLTGNHAAKARRRSAGLRLERLLVSLDVAIEKPGVFPLPNARQQRQQSILDISHDADVNRMAATDVGGVDIDLDDIRVVRIKLSPSEIGTQKHQRVAV